MVDISVTAAAHHDEASHHLVVAANLQADAAEQCLEGDFAEAEMLAQAAARASETAKLHALQAVAMYREMAEHARRQKNAALLAETASAPLEARI